VHGQEAVRLLVVLLEWHACCRDVVGVQQLANAVDRSQMIMLRANFIAKCANPAMQVRCLACAAPCVCGFCSQLTLQATFRVCKLTEEAVQTCRKTCWEPWLCVQQS
jgi:hypothetical protein